MVRRWPCRSGYVIYIYIYIACRSGTLLGMQECRHAGVAIIEFRSDSSLAMQEWLVVGHAGVARRWPCRSGSSLYRHARVAIHSMQEWLVVGHAGVAIILAHSMQEWLVVGRAGMARRWLCRSGSSLAMQEWLVYYHNVGRRYIGMARMPTSRNTFSKPPNSQTKEL